MRCCDVRFQIPFTCLISGMTGSGKSSITFKLIKYRRKLIAGEIVKVLYCLPSKQTIEVPNFIRRDRMVSFHEGLPDIQTLPSNTLLILDDMMSETDSNIMQMFTRESHHRGISVCFLVQNLFFAVNKYFRTISLNCHYMIITKNPREKMQISSLASQVYPENVKFLKEAFFDATKKPFGYLLLDLTQRCSDKLRFRTNIFPCDFPHNIFYVEACTSEDV